MGALIARIQISISARSRQNKKTPDGVFLCEVAPRVGLEPTTLRLTAECSTIELPRNFYDVLLL